MKLKKLVRYEKAFFFFVGIVMIPFAIVLTLFYCCCRPFEWVLENLDEVRHKFGNYLLRKSDEFKDCTIRNKTMIRKCTASHVYKRLTT